jgi:plastocyanin domain-containing protein
MKMRRLTSLFVVTILLLVFLANNARTEEKKVVAPIGPDGVQRVEMVGGSYFFDPNYIIVKVNVPVEIKIRKESGMIPHDFVLKAPEAGMDVKVELGKEPQTIRFTPTKVGEYPFYCDKKLLFFESHRDKGMKGVLKVEE